ncbi:hepatoma-derived growth factor-related protein 2-like [Vespa mandarinia]|uniref:hepatoma-derived growth factor-related protein 2-like n=1 Tax=Vespa mandarinia TaxID=7446 RepID=UPI0016086683|nr:hepatoma-derived growth factor-related protein 2-like [Vespa mandarinia]
MQFAIISGIDTYYYCRSLRRFIINMVKLLKKFFPGDKVFAKVRGYPPWPAKVEKVVDSNSKNAKYNVYFYGTGETAVCKVEELFTYTENKAKFGNKALRRKFFHEGLQQLEQELKNERSKAGDIDDLQESDIVEETGTKGSNVASGLPTASATDSDLESGSLIIDEGNKKKSLKRKPFSTSSNNPETPELKKKRGKAKALSTSTSDTSKQELALDSQGEESPKEIVSRSGRKIKPKRFADFSSSEETEEHSGRGRGKIKNDESNEHISSAGTYKKRNITTEKKNSIGETSLMEGTVVSNPTSSETPGRFLLARTFAGEYVGIKLDVDRPKSFDSEKARTQWDWTTARNAMKLKGQLESGEILPEQVKDSLDFNVYVPEDEKRLLAKDGAIHRKTYKLRWLRIEAQLLQLDAQIKSNLGLDRANTDKCLEAMDEILSLSIDPLMLKKHPHIVETVKRLRRYIGNLADWKLSKEEEAVFKQKAEQIRQKAEHIYNKFKAMFTIPEGQSFWQSFSDQVDHFKELTKDMPEEKVFSLMSDPTCPDAAGISEDATADDSGSQVDTDVTVKIESEQVPIRIESPKETETK